MGNSIVRTDRWPLNPTPETKTYLEMTVAEYRSFCKALSYVVMGHWRKIASANSRCTAVETLIHKTNKNPHPTYSYFGTRFYKFPSYLRRAAIEFVCGQVSSFLTRYEQWQCGSRNCKDARPPQFTPDSGCYPVLYREQCIKIHNLVQLTENKVVEVGGGVALVYPRGTSSWAFDGSGQVTRSQHNYALATFQTGK